MAQHFVKHTLRGLAGLALLLASGAAFALGLGEIRVKSQPGQPLLAEIPIISNEPGELEQLQARLASPATFDRVGLPRPQGLVSGLNFAVALSDDGRAVIRVTSAEPVQVAAVNFLVEVDWGQGRLVREYSALVDAPGALATANQPIIEAPLPPPSNTIIREPEPIASVPLPPEPASAPVEASTPTPAPVPVPVAPRPRPVAPPVQSTASAAGEVQVQRGQTLSQIARDVGQGYTLDQSMLALLRANPDAFINGNINRLKQGAVLRVPQSAELAQLGEDEAAALVRDQLAEWRQARRPIPQPVDAVPTPVATAPARSTTPTQRVAPARLEIAPPAANAATRAGTQSGIDAEGEGDMLANQQLTLTKEELAAREAEVQELRAQVAELESLKQQQAKLIAMKDSELASAQERLANSQGDAAQPLWLWAGLGLLVAGLVVAWLIGRRKSTPVAARPAYDSAALAAAIPVAAEPEAQAPTHDDLAASEVDYDSDVPATLPEEIEAASTLDVEPELQPGPAPVAPVVAAQAWTTAATKPTWHTGDAGLNVAPLNAAPAGRERLELAIAYLDLGDVETARDLLNEVALGGDATARDEAVQLLRELG
jgi:pilus assembly protein FimV